VYIYLPPWFNKKLKQILFLKWKAHITFKSFSNAHNYKEYSLLRDRFKYESNKYFRSYVERIESLLASNHTDYQKIVKNNRSFSKILKQDSISGSTKREATNLFSTYFFSVFSDAHFDLDTLSLGFFSFDIPNN